MKVVEPENQDIYNPRWYYMMSGKRYAMKDQPSRVAAIKKQLKKDKRFDFVSAKRFPQGNILNTHKHAKYIKKISRSKKHKNTDLYPDIFPHREIDTYDLRKNKHWMSFYCLDVMTPVSYNTFKAAKKSAEAAMTAARLLVDKKEKYIYALCRPSGHHAGPSVFGGYCYFNNAALAAGVLAEKGAKTAILDIDYHHGNGQQVIFYRRSDVLTVSIHGHPRFAYPYFSGFEDETGEEEGLDFNLNLPLAETISVGHYQAALAKALRRIARFKPDYLVICVGFDTAKGDPTGTWNLNAADFQQLGLAIGGMQLPTMLAQEGGYRTRSIGVNARSFFSGLWSGAFRA